MDSLPTAARAGHARRKGRKRYISLKEKKRTADSRTSGEVKGANMIAARDVATGEVDVGRRNHTNAMFANCFVALGFQATWKRAVSVSRAFWRGGNVGP
jgi:hypothetical protein